MNKIITQEEIKAVLQTVYQTNISAATFDALKKLFVELPNEVKQEDKKSDGQGDAKTE